MFKTHERPARMIPRGDDDGAPDIFRAQKPDRELRVFPRRARAVFQLNDIAGHARPHQQPAVDLTVAETADDDARRGRLLEKFRRALGPFAQAAAQNHDGIGLHWPAVHAQNLLWQEKRGGGQRDQQNAQRQRNPQNPFSLQSHRAGTSQFSARMSAANCRPAKIICPFSAAA